MKNTSIIITIIVIVLLVGGGMLYLRPTAEAPTPEEVFTDDFDNVPPAGSGQLIQDAPAMEDGDAADEMVVSSPEPATTEAADSANVSIDEAGFTPKTVTVAAGTTVTFVNNGQAPHWPASDNHPTHEILPEFDAKAGIATGEMYSHTFTEVGTWMIHDHLNPAATGTIIVQ